MLLGLKHRFELLNVDDPWAVVVDNCCHFRNIIMKVFSDTVVLQDVWHVIMRYACHFQFIYQLIIAQFTVIGT